jgi:hypothetical protein
MAQSLEFAPRRVRLRAPLLAALILAFTGCDANETLNPSSSIPPEDVEILTVDDPAGIGDAADLVNDADADVETTSLAAPSFASVSYAGGIPFGAFHQPTTAYGTYYNGGLRNIYPSYLLSHLAGIKARGGKVVLNLAGAEGRYKDSNGNFSLTKWKASVDRFRNVNFSSYISDGTIIAHFLLDEPSNTARWNGKVVSYSTIEEMARYSKARYPGLATTIRAYPTWLAKYSGSYRYLDAAWVQYVYRFGNVSDFMKLNISKAQQKGLALIVGLNVLKGGPNKAKMTASQIKSWGSTLLATSYPCAFISWEYNSTYFSYSSVKDAMKYLRSKAQSRSTKSCRS